MPQRSGILFIVLTIVLTVGGQLLVKHGMTQIGKSPSAAGEVPMFLLRAIFHPSNGLGLLSAVLAAMCWMGALSRCDLSFAYPFMALAIVLVLALTPALFGEHVHSKQWTGVAIVCLGLWIASRPS